MRVKICGLTTLADARTALEAGADLLGFNFYRPSPRYVPPETVAQLITTLRAEFAGRVFRCVGVFVNEPPADMRAIMQLCQLDLAQLHGDEPPAVVHAVGEAAFKALRIGSADEADWLARTYAPNHSDAAEHKPAFLIDASHATLYGCTGQTADWSTARWIAEHYPILLAGGLNPSNVADAIHVVRPWGVDVASGVERAPGVKDVKKMVEFVKAVKRQK